MEAPIYSDIERGTLMISSPEVDSIPLFDRSVVLICENSSNGSFGLILNKTLEIELPEDILAMESIEDGNILALSGGPVQTNQMMLLHSCESIPQKTLPICEGVYLGGDLEFLQDSVSEENSPQMRLCFGYSGWSGGQLEREFLQNDWFLYPASKEIIFDTALEEMWTVVLRKMGGRYASLSMIPDDLSLN